MIFKETRLKGAFVVELEKRVDERGFFARAWCRHEFGSRGLSSDIVQCNISFNHQRGTLRGMHYQAAPHEEIKIVRCIKGAVCDVVIDLRPNSETFKEWHAVELTADNRKMMYVPKGFAQGFLTLTDDCEIFYQMSTDYAPAFARGVRWNDSAFGIEWPEKITVISKRDNTYPDFMVRKGQSL
jgi:dTDP-4-dehydrorhamnose 3,5-epimerase